MLMSGSSLAISQNTYAKMYNAADVLTIMKTEKSMKGHVCKLHVQSVMYIDSSVTQRGRRSARVLSRRAWRPPPAWRAPGVSLQGAGTAAWRALSVLLSRVGDRLGIE